MTRNFGTKVNLCSSSDYTLISHHIATDLIIIPSNLSIQIFYPSGYIEIRSESRCASKTGILARQIGRWWQMFLHSKNRGFELLKGN